MAKNTAASCISRFVRHSKGVRKGGRVGVKPPSELDILPKLYYSGSV